MPNLFLPEDLFTKTDKRYISIVLIIDSSDDFMFSDMREESEKMHSSFIDSIKPSYLAVRPTLDTIHMRAGRYLEDRSSCYVSPADYPQRFQFQGCGLRSYCQIPSVGKNQKKRNRLYPRCTRS